MEKIYELLFRYYNGEITPEEKETLFRNVNSDLRWKEEFVYIQNLRALTSWIPSDNDFIEGVSHLNTFRKSRVKKRNILFSKHIVGYAAAVLITAIVSWSVITFQVSKEKQEDQLLAAIEEANLSYEEFTAPPGQRALVKLQDGTTVWLNARTTLRYPNRFSRTERRVELDGEAFFDVTKNENSPFIVSTEKLDIKVTGTEFNVFAYHGQDEFNASLMEGSIRIYNKKDEANGMDLYPFERAVLIDRRLEKRQFKQMDFLLWKDGIYAFDDMSFGEIVKKLELYYDVTIEVQNNRLEKYRFNGKFRQRDGVESVLKTMRNIQHFTYLKDDEQNVITIK